MIKTRYLLLILAIVLICIGVYLGEQDMVFREAIRICLECIGIG